VLHVQDELEEVQRFVGGQTQHVLAELGGPEVLEFELEQLEQHGADQLHVDVLELGVLALGRRHEVELLQVGLLVLLIREHEPHLVLVESFAVFL